MSDKNYETSEKDINDLFDSIALSEDTISNKAFEEGLIKGKEDGKIDGYHLGYHRGLELGCELGFYNGFTQIILKNFEEKVMKNKEKILSLIEKLVCLINTFPENNADNIDITKEMDDIRACYKKLTSLLKLNLPYPSFSQLSF